MLRRFATEVLILAGSIGFLGAQPLAQTAPKIVIDPDKPDEIIAYVDGKPFTQRHLADLLVSMSKVQQDAVHSNPVEALRMYGWLQKMTRMAEERGLDKQSPYAQKLEMNRLTVLSEAMIQQRDVDDVVTPEMQKAWFEQTKDRYTTAHIKILYLPYSNATEELQSKNKAEELAAKVKAGADFVALVKEFSKDQTSRDKDGDYNPVKRSDDLPEPVKQAIFALQPGEVSAPIRLPNGYYLIKMVRIETQSYDAVKDQIYVELKQERSRAWMQKLRTAVEVKVVEPPKTK